MQLDVGANCHDFWDKHLFYVLLVIPTSVHVTGRSNFSDAGVGLVPIMFPDYLPLPSLDPAQCIPTDRKNTLYLSALKCIAVFVEPPMKTSHHAPSTIIKATHF